MSPNDAEYELEAIVGMIFVVEEDGEKTGFWCLKWKGYLWSDCTWQDAVAVVEGGAVEVVWYSWDGDGECDAISYAEGENEGEESE